MASEKQDSWDPGLMIYKNLDSCKLRCGVCGESQVKASRHGWWCIAWRHTMLGGNILPLGAIVIVVIIIVVVIFEEPPSALQLNCTQDMEDGLDATPGTTAELDVVKGGHGQTLDLCHDRQAHPYLTGVEGPDTWLLVGREAVSGVQCLVGGVV